MRSHWEEGADVDLDAPATITERELRALRRRAGFGVFAVLLGGVAVGGLGWTLYAGPDGLATVQGMKDRILSGASSAPEPGGAEGQARAAAPERASDSTTATPAAANTPTATDSAGGTP